MNSSRSFGIRPTLLLALAVPLLTLASCGGGGGGSSSPTDPPPVPQNQPAVIQGSWTGSATTTSASGTCLADDFRPLTVPVRWTFQQSGTLFTAQQSLNGGLACNFRGSVSGSSVTFFPDLGGPAFCTVQTIVCPRNPQRPLRIELETNTSIQTASVTGNRMTTTSTATWHVTDLRTGQVVGDFVVRGSQDLQKQ